MRIHSHELFIFALSVALIRVGAIAKHKLLGGGAVLL
ncbi:hypothetical protein N007_06305 [Alicyclobacillus acidoterrestris ATCC 49025]|nr:hypothetical protein N007_06305 [Alicyclobacillus acidoterrestris ATCC 49025]